MSKTMKIFTKTTAVALSAAVMFSAIPASAQINSVGDLLNKVRSDSSKTAADNQAREQKFRQRRDQQSGLLGEAQRELRSLESKASSVQSSFDANQRTIDRLEGELKAAQGDFGEVFGLARSKAGEFKAILDNSLITAQYPTRGEVLGRVAESKALPSSDDLNAIWQTMLQEIKAQRQVARLQPAKGLSFYLNYLSSLVARFHLQPIVLLAQAPDHWFMPQSTPRAVSF